MLNTRELLSIAAVLASARAVRSYGMSSEKESCLDQFFRTLQANKFLEDKIVTSIPAEDEIADAASSELADIRRKMRAAAARVRDSLQKIISAPSMARFLQDPIITTRSDRYVVPVKAEFKGSVPGLVHDVSASGATLFVEPMAAVKANNEIRELKAKEKAEIERILAELSADCAEHRTDIDGDYAVLVHLDMIFARAKLSFKLDAMEPELSEKGIRLRRARHPLLEKGKAVPIDVELGDDYVDFPYSPGYVYENAKLDEQGFLVMNEGGGSLSAEYNSVAGAWNYSVYYDTAETSGNAFMEIQIGENQFMYTSLDLSGGFVNADDVVMSTKAPVPFMINASEGVKIKRIEIRCKN